MANGTFTIHEVVSASGASLRSFRYWTGLKLIPKPIGRGRGARYDDRHLLRATLIEHLSRAGASTRAIRAQLGSKTDDELRAMLPPPQRATTPDGVPVPPPAPSYPAQHWEIVVLMDGLLLFVDPSKGEVLRRIADDIYRHYSLLAAR